MAAPQEAGTVVSVRDGVWVEREGTRLPLASKDRIYPNDRIVTDESGKAQILFADDSLVALSANSSLAVNDFVFDSSSTPVFNAEVPKGVARFLTGKVVQQNRSGFSVETPQAVVGIRGTTFAVQVSDDGGTSVAGIDVNSALPIEVRNTVTGTASRIENAGEAIQATAQGSTRYQLASVPASQNPLSSEAAQGSELPAISWEEGAATTSVQASVSGSVAADETSSIQIDTLPSFKDVIEDVLADNGAGNGGGSSGGGGTGPGNGGNPGGGGTPGGGTPGGGTGPINAQYTGTLTHGTGSTLAGAFSFDVSLSGATGTINNATMSINQGIGESFHATGGSASISGGNFTIDNFTSMTTNVAGLPSDPQAWMQGGITDTSTSGNWQIKNPVEWGSNMRHQGKFTGTP